MEFNHKSVLLHETIENLNIKPDGIYVDGKKAWTQPRVGKKQENAQEGHECLRITDPSLTPDEYNKIDANNLNQKVYRLIWQRTIAPALPNAKISASCSWNFAFKTL